MSLLITFNGSNYIIPQTNEVGWGSNLDDYFVAIAAGCLQKTGGSFTLSAETDFGASYGLKSLYYRSRTANVADAGQIRLARADVLSFRNQGGSGNLDLGVNSSNQLTFNGTAIGGSGIFTASRAIVSDGSGNLTSATTTSTEIGYVNGVTSAIQTQLNAKQTTTLTSGNILVGDVSNVAASVAVSGDISITNAGVTAIGAGKIVNAQVNASAAIAYSKLNLTGSILNADVNASAAIAYSKLSLTGGIVNADVNASAAIAYSKLNLATSIVNADVSASAAIAYSKLNLATSIVNADISTSAAIAITKIANGTANQVLGTNAGASANEWKTLTATSNQVSVTHGVGTVTFATPQDIGTASAVRFGSLTLGGALDASSILSLTSTSKGFLPPVMTTTQKNAISTPTDGLVVYDSSLAQLFLRASSAWTPLSVGGGSGTVSSGTAGRLTLYGAAGTTVADTYVQNSQNITLAIATQASRSAGLAITIPNPGNAVTTANVLLDTDTGTYTIAGTWTHSVALAISPTSNQLVLGATRTVTITAPTPATSSRVWTIPDLSGDATFAALSGAVTYTGVKTFSSKPVFSAGVTSNDSVAVDKTAASANVSVDVSNDDNTSGTSNARVTITSGGTSGGDAFVQLGIPGGTTYAIGVDNSDSDKLKFDVGTTPSAGADAMTIDASQNVSIGNTHLQIAGNQAYPILQVVVGTSTTAFTTTNSSSTDTNLSVSITPKFNTSKILLIATGDLSNNNASGLGAAMLARGSTDLEVGASGAAVVGNATATYFPVTLHYYDSPATTSSTTYKVRVFATTAGTVAWGHFAYQIITAIEIAQ